MTILKLETLRVCVFYTHTAIRLSAQSLYPHLQKQAEGKELIERAAFSTEKI